MLQGLPENGASHTTYLYGVVLVIFGCLKSWVSAPAVPFALHVLLFSAPALQ